MVDQEKYNQFFYDLKSIFKTIFLKNNEWLELPLFGIYCNRRGVENRKKNIETTYKNKAFVPKENQNKYLYISVNRIPSYFRLQI